MMAILKKIKWWMWVLLYVLLVISLTVIEIVRPPNSYQTTDASLYRVYPKGFDVEIVELANAVFPTEIEEHFENTSYSLSYDAWGGGSEMWLEFTIQDPGLYLAHKAEVLAGNETTPFRYDDSFEEYAIADKAYRETTDEGTHYLITTDILKVLFCDEKQTIIYVAVYFPVPTLKMYLPSDFIYFERFSIDVSELPSYYS